MSKLSGLFGRRKKKKKQTLHTLQDENFVIYKHIEFPQHEITVPESLPQNVDDNENYRPENYQLLSSYPTTKMFLAENQVHENKPLNRITFDPKNQTVNLNRLSKVELFEQGGRRKYLGRVSVLVPLSQAGQISGQRRVSKILNGPDVQPRKLSRVQDRFATRFSTVEPKQTSTSGRASVLVPLSQIGQISEQKRVSKILYEPEVQPRKLSRVQDRFETSFSTVEPKQTSPSGRVSVLIPLSQIEQISEQKRVSKILYAPEVQPRKLSRVQGHFETSYTVVDPKQTRTSSVIQRDVVPGPQKQIRLSVVSPIEANECSRPGRLSMIRTSDGTDDGFPLNPTHQPVVYAVRRSISKPKNRKLSFIKRNFLWKKKAEQEEEDADSYVYSQTEPAIFAYSEPTRGRTSEILQQSIKAISSRKDDSPVVRKNIRYSMDMDVFSPDVKRRNEKPHSPAYVNMERGQGMLVSEFLNPITSIFVCDLKDPIPKDPLTKPREYNNWVRPRQGSMYQKVSPKPRVKIAPVIVTGSKMQRRETKNQQYYSHRSKCDDKSSENEDDSCSYESEESYNPQSNYRKPAHHRVYAAAIPNGVLPQAAHVKDDARDLVTNLTPPSTSKSKYSIGNVIENKPGRRLSLPPYVGRLSLAEERKITDTLDFLCKPPVRISKGDTLALGSGSELQRQMEREKEDESDS